MARKKHKNLEERLGEIKDPRAPSNGTLHDFREILLMIIMAVLSDCDAIEDIAEWAKNREEWLRRILVLKNGVPSQKTFQRILCVLDPKRLEATFRRWAWGIAKKLDGSLAIDGKTVRGSGSGGETAIHMVSAFSTQFGLVLGQEKVAAKSNEITAIPELLEALQINGLLVSIDAMGCQKTIARLITGRDGDYLLAVKNNQPALFDAIETEFISRSGDSDLDQHHHTEKSHGRTVGQVATVMSAKGVVDPIIWSQCKTIGRIDSIRRVGDKLSDLERRYYISSRELSAKELAVAARAHWGIENRLHWVLDVTFNEDASTVRIDNAPQNLSLLRKIVLNLLRIDQTERYKKCSLRLKRKHAAWDDEYRAQVMGIQIQ
jgi:predicted transposase YbfD/YdcC